ncbi:hypothetical protein D915_006222 [Fasciola hepatica]|uniref:PH domain-containing protein n=1 Tax=Fasciola hepatica TaxID=6192 RepID=A0A4E0RAF4_FASHE|nr:hypothetical protein D915_006222 [Fasciola hepatica]
MEYYDLIRLPVNKFIFPQLFSNPSFISSQRHSALLPWIQTFLKEDLGSVPLPPPIETKRLAIVDQLDRLTRSVAQSSNLAVPSVAPTVQPSPQRRPFSTVARLFTSSSSRKRFSLPASISLAPPLIEVPVPARSSPRPTEPPLPPKGTHKTRLSNESGRTNQDYEEPRSVMVRAADPALQHRRHPLARLSLSPQLEITESHRTGSIQSTIGPGGDSSSILTDTRDDIDLTLPKRCLTTQARRFSAFMDPPWTLAGSLHQRYKPNKWTRLNLCLLIGGSRLIGYRSGHALTPNLVLFLCGCTGIYAGRDSGMDHVIKITHSTRGMAVLAADTEEQALVWIRQINSYAQGITPSEVVSFLEQPSRISPVTTGVAVVQPPGVTEQRVDASGNCSGVVAVVGSTVPGEPQEDSGFSAPLSSGSEANSADGVISSLSNHQLSLMADRGINTNAHCAIPPVESYPQSDRIAPSSSTQSIELDQVRLRHKTKTAESVPKSRPVSLFSSSSRTTLPAGFRPNGLLRRDPTGGGIGSGLLSSVRRKVESFHSKRRARKSLPQSFVAPCESSILSKANSSADLLSQSIPVTDLPVNLLTTPSAVASRGRHREQTGSNGQWVSCNGQTETTGVVPPPAACVLNSPTRVGPGFNWAQLESACSLFLNPLSPGGSGGLRRPHSFVLSGPVFADYTHGQTGVESLVNVTNPRLGPLLDLRALSTETQQDAAQPDVNYRHDIIIADLSENNHSIPVSLSSCLEYDIPDDLDSPDKSRCPTLISPEPKVQHSSQPHQFAMVNPDHYKLDSLSDSGSTNIYDEVCSPTMQDQTVNSVNGVVFSQFKRRWSSPSLPLSITPRPRMCWYGANRAEKEASSLSPVACTVPKANETSSIRSWHIPPPSRLLLAQPLPPLPSVGPSAAESIAGTMTSSRTSSSQTPEEHRTHLCSSSSHISEPEPDFANTSNPIRNRPSKSSYHNRCRCGSQQYDGLPTNHNHHTPHSSPNIYSNPAQIGHKRHSSLGSLDDDGERQRYTTDSAQTYQSLQRNASHHPNPGILGWLVDSVRSHIIEAAPARANLEQSVRSGHTIKASGRRGEDVGSVSEVTNTLEISCPSETSLLGSSETHVHSTGPQLPWFDLPAQWWLDHHQQHAKAEHSAIAAARRSVSCITGTKPCLALTDARTAATLPARHEAETVMLRPPLFNRQGGQLSQHSSHTATSSSGVALTVGSSSCSGSGCTTRPGSHLALSWPPPPVPEEPSGWPDSETQDVYVYPSDLHLRSASVVKSAREIQSSMSYANPNRNDIHVQCDSISNHSSRNSSPSKSHAFISVHGSPNNTSLILAATQLEEVHEEANKLRSRRQTLSSRLTKTLTKHRRHTTDCLLPATQNETVEQSSENPVLVSSTTPVPTDDPKVCDPTGTVLLDQSVVPVLGHVEIDPSEAGNRNEVKIPVNKNPTQPRMPEQTETIAVVGEMVDELPEEEAVESLCARLAAVELLIQQAESTEARLREEFNQHFQQAANSRPDQCFGTNDRLSGPIPITPPVNSVHAKIATLDTSVPIAVLSPRRRRRGRHGRLFAVSQNNQDQGHPTQNGSAESVCFSGCHLAQPRAVGSSAGNNTTNSHTITTTATSGGRGGGRSKRRRGAGPAGPRRERRQPPPSPGWNKTSNPNACPVAISPAS